LVSVALAALGHLSLPASIEARDLVVAQAIEDNRPFAQSGVVLPYSIDNLWRGFTGGNCRHQALDFGGIGPEGGIGTPIVSMARSEIVMLGLAELEPGKFGKPDKRKGKTKRGKRSYSRVLEVEGYGKVYPFSRSKGSWGSGTTIIARALDGELAGYTLRYMHLAAVHPSLKVGDIVEAGQEIALLGGTGSQNAGPHLHLDIEDPQGRRVDPAWVLGLVEEPATCKPLPKKKPKKKKKKKRK
jgi:hypothetical protein